MKVEVTELANSFKVKFPYSSHAVELIKVIPGRQFRKDMGNAWLIPKTSQRALRRFIDQIEGKAAVAAIQKPYQDPKTVYPTCRKTDPWPHQLEALRFIWNKDAALIDLPMGRGGKSRIIVDYICNKKVMRTLIVCPKAVIPVWPVQFERHAGLEVRVVPLISGKVAVKAREAKITLEQQLLSYRDTPVVLVINYDSFWRDDFADFALRADIDLLVLDEVQRAKGAGTNTGKFCYQLGAQVPTVFGLSGTPFPHGPDDVYGVYRALDPTIFGTSYKRHQDEFFEMGGFENRQIIGYKNVAKMQELINSIRFHVEPPKLDIDEQHTDIVVDLPARARKIYETLREDLYVRIGNGEVTSANAAVNYTRLQQLTSGHMPVELLDDDDVAHVETKVIHEAKQNVLFDLLTDLDKNEPIVIFCRFRYDLQAVQDVAKKLGRGCCELSGRKHELEAWQHGKAPILAAQLRSGAVGVDMTRACLGVYYSYTFSLEEYEQSIKRLARPGQTRNCTFYHIVANKTVDYRIRRALAQRRNIIESLLEIPREDC
jgi:superfamily II DNA or RNA helicase